MPDRAWGDKFREVIQTQIVMPGLDPGINLFCINLGLLGQARQ